MEKLSHAYIVSSASPGQRAELATELAMKMLCRAASERPCGLCRDCRKIKAGIHPDVVTVTHLSDKSGKPRRDILVDQIRELGADASVLPNEADGKVYIIEDADTMNEQAQNAALKLFEEPPRGVNFVLCAANSDKLLETVRSRCAEIRRNTPDEQAAEDMQTLAEAYLRALECGAAAELTQWCVKASQTEGRRIPEFIMCAERLLTRELKLSEPDRKRKIMQNLSMLSECSAFLRVNTGARHIFGYIAVKSQPIGNGE